MSPQASLDSGHANAADRRYLDQVLSTIRAWTEMSAVAAGRSADPGIRRLAEHSASTQRAWGRTVLTAVKSADRPEPLPGGERTAAPAGSVENDATSLQELDGPDLDLRFVELLQTHALASLVSARTEMVEGVNRHGRRIAEASIRLHCPRARRHRTIHVRARWDRGENAGGCQAPPRRQGLSTYRLGQMRPAGPTSGPPVGSNDGTSHVTVPQRPVRRRMTNLPSLVCGQSRR
jgi:uncharacterized protein (DUF305 family)